MTTRPFEERHRTWNRETTNAIVAVQVLLRAAVKSSDLCASTMTMNDLELSTLESLLADTLAGVRACISAMPIDREGGRDAK